MAVTGPVTEVMRAGRVAHPGPARARRAAPRRGGRRATVRCWPSTRARRSPPAASACARCWSSWPPTASEGEGLVRAATAVELVHSATLVHDDVLDAAALRRGVPTVVATAGPRDRDRDRRPALRPRLRGAGRQRPRRRGPRALRRVLGAGARASCCSAPTPGTRPCRSSATCAAASSRPRACSRRPASWARWRPTAHPRQLGAFGRRIGLAFQLLDDVLDVSGPASRTGKQRGTDLLDGTVTLPFILARERDAELGALDPRTDRLRRAGRGRLRSHRGHRARWTRRAPARWRWSTRPRPDCPRGSRRASATRSSSWPRASWPATPSGAPLACR